MFSQSEWITSLRGKGVLTTIWGNSIWHCTLPKHWESSRVLGESLADHLPLKTLPSTKTWQTYFSLLDATCHALLNLPEPTFHIFFFLPQSGFVTSVALCQRSAQSLCWMRSFVMVILAYLCDLTRSTRPLAPAFEPKLFVHTRIL